MQWVTHEVWVPGTKSVSFVDWPRGTRLIDSTTDKARWITRFPAWHAAPDDTGRKFVCDSNFPDRGIHIFMLEQEESAAHFVVASGASSEGAHWAGPFPYNDGPIEVQARQHTHPHPRFSPDGRHILFTSDKTGFAQLYEVTLPDE
jgi:oligogalacturonide lyase